MLRVLQFTDLHLRDDPDASAMGVRTQYSFETVVHHASLRHWPADAILLTGDLANDEHGDSYRRLVGIAAGWDTPLLAVPGNHDDSAALFAAFANAPKARRNVLDFPRWRIVALDSRVPRAVHGELDSENREILDTAAATRGERHLLVALHHPPLALKSAWIDRLGLRDGDAFRVHLSMLGARACIFGHAHQAWDSEENGVRYLCAPSTSRQMEPQTEEFQASDAAPGYRWLHLHDDGSIETGIERVEDAKAEMIGD